MCTGCLKTNSFTATVATRPRAVRPATVPPAMSTCAMIQPPKMSPFWLASAGIGITRSAGTFPSGSLSSTCIYIVKRAAAERGEAGAEDEAGIDEVGIGHDAFCEYGFRLAQVGLDQRVDHGLVIGVGLPLDRLVVHPAVDALAALLAEVPEGHLVRENLGDLSLPFRERLPGGEADVEPDRVGELRRAHRHAEVLHRAVERLGLVALVEH